LGIFIHWGVYAVPAYAYPDSYSEWYWHSLRAPLEPLPVQRLLKGAVPDAWKADEATVLALSVALANQEGHPLPWAVLRRAVDDAIASRWLETTPESGAWPCEVAAAGTVSLRPPVGFDPTSITPAVSKTTAGYGSSAVLDPAALQDLVDALPEIVKAAAGLPLEFRLNVKLGASVKDIESSTVDSIDRLLRDVNPDLSLKR